LRRLPGKAQAIPTELSLSEDLFFWDCLTKRKDTMTKEKFLTVRWNNVLSLALGIPTLLYIIYAFSTSFWTTSGGLIGLAIIGVLY
jgi:hypothetical protein